MARVMTWSRRQVERLAALERGIEHLPIEQLALVVDLDLVAGSRMRAVGGAGTDDLVLEPARQTDDARLLGVEAKEALRRLQIGRRFVMNLTAAQEERRRGGREPEPQSGLGG